MLSTPVLAQSIAPRSVAEQYLFSAANTARAEQGLPSLRWDDALFRAASGHARQMAARRSISHQYPEELDLAARAQSAKAHFSKISENVAVSPDAITMHDAWMHSPGHRANLLDPQVDSVAISVVKRDGELYAVEDFERSVTNLSVEEQENVVEAGLKAISVISVMTPNVDSRRTCMMDSGFAGSKQPGFVMRYTTANLLNLPEILKERVRSGMYEQAIVGACETGGLHNFTTYSIAVMLFP
jgi:hypothetical protein